MLVPAAVLLCDVLCMSISEAARGCPSVGPGRPHNKTNCVNEALTRLHPWRGRGTAAVLDASAETSRPGRCFPVSRARQMGCGGRRAGRYWSVRGRLLQEVPVMRAATALPTVPTRLLEQLSLAHTQPRNPG